MIKYEFALPDQDQLFQLYENDGWNEFLKLPKEKLHKAMEQSWLVISAYDGDCLIGTGRIISDGVINAYLCGLIVDPGYRAARASERKWCAGWQWSARRHGCMYN